MSKLYTPGPWFVRTELNIHVLCIASAEQGKHVTHVERAEDAKRIVSCVNACEGMQDPKTEIERMKWQISHLISHANELATIAEEHLEGYYGEETERVWKIREFINNLK